MPARFDEISAKLLISTQCYQRLPPVTAILEAMLEDNRRSGARQRPRQAPIIPSCGIHVATHTATR